jgi:phosphoribosylformylglycinamidine synthase
MILYFKDKFETIFAVDSSIELNEIDLKKLEWLFVAKHINQSSINSNFIGPKKTMISPWSTNAVEISENMAILGILRIEKFISKKYNNDFDPMLFEEYPILDQKLFIVSVSPKPIIEIEDVSDYNQKEGLALNNEEINYLNEL